MTTYPTPWNVEATNALDHDDRTTVPMAQITAADGTPVCQLRGADAAELAGLIVRAVNEARTPDFLSDALNSGDGSYRP